MAILIPWNKIFANFWKLLPGIIGVAMQVPKENLVSNISSYIPIDTNYLPSWLAYKEADIYFQYVGIALIISSIVLLLWNPFIKWVIKRNEHISLEEAFHIFYTLTKRADFFKWHLAGATREKVTQHDLLPHIKSGKIHIYGFITLKGKKTSYQKIEKISSNEIPENYGNDNRWNENYSIIFGADGNPKYIEISLRKIKLYRLIKIININLKIDIVLSKFNVFIHC